MIDNRLNRFALLCAVLALAASLPTPAFAQCAGVPASTTGSITWTPAWCDEFNGAANSQINPANWTYDTGSSGFGNNELEDYCAPSDNTSPCSTTSPNAFIDGSGHLAIQVRGPANSDCKTVGTCTSARLKTAGLQSFHSGRIEASIQIPSHSGLWPAFWMLGSQSGVSWPTVGESDIMENWPLTSSIQGPGATGNCSTIHTQVTAGPGKGQCSDIPKAGQVDTAFHIYGQIWSANMVQYYIDDPTQPFFVVTASDLPSGDTWPFSSSANPFFLIMNMAVGGTLGNPTDNGTSSQQPMLVDYVRQYLPSAIAGPQVLPQHDITIKAGDTVGNTTTVELLATATGTTGLVTFSCSTNAPKASCTVEASGGVNNHTFDFDLASAAGITATVNTTANTREATSLRHNWIRWGGLGLLGFVLLPISKNARRVGSSLVLATAALVVSLMLACGGSSASGAPSRGATGTPPGNYTVTINTYTISSSDAAAPSSTGSFNLTVN